MRRKASIGLTHRADLRGLPWGGLGEGVVPSGEWTPLDLPGLVLWLDASTITGIPDGGDISQWDDLSGNARHATQAVALDKPHFREAYQNGLGAVEFDSVDHWMDLDFSSGIGAADHTFVFALETRNTGTNGDQRLLYFSPVNLLSINSVTSTLGKVGYYDVAWVHAANATDAAQVLAFQLDNAGAELFRNGVSIAAGLPHTNRALGDPASLGANNTGLYQFDGHLFECVNCSPILDAANLVLLVNYLMAKWAIP